MWDFILCIIQTNGYNYNMGVNNILIWGGFHVNQPSRTMRDMSLEGVNYVQDFLELFFEIKQHHAKEICLKTIMFINNIMEWKYVKGI